MTGVPALAAAGAAAGEGGSAVLVGEGGAAALATAAELLSGPVGWAILGGTAVVGAAVAAASIYNAHSKAQANLKPADTAQPCHDCGDRPDCFTPPDRKDPEKLKEFRRQLKGQQDGINKMSPQDVIDGIKKYKAGGREAFPGEEGMRRTFRDQAKKAALRAARRNGLSKAEAEQAARDAMAGKGRRSIILISRQVVYQSQRTSVTRASTLRSGLSGQNQSQGANRHVPTNCCSPPRRPRNADWIKWMSL